MNDVQPNSQKYHLKECVNQFGEKAYLTFEYLNEQRFYEYLNGSVLFVSELCKAINPASSGIFQTHLKVFIVYYSIINFKQIP